MRGDRGAHLGDGQETVQQHGGQEEGLLMEAVFAGNLDKPADSDRAHGGIDVEGRVHVTTMVLHVAGIRSNAVLSSK